MPLIFAKQLHSIRFTRYQRGYKQGREPVLQEPLLQNFLYEYHQNPLNEIQTKGNEPYSKKNEYDWKALGLHHARTQSLHSPSNSPQQLTVNFKKIKFLFSTIQVNMFNYIPTLLNFYDIIRLVISRTIVPQEQRNQEK